MARRARSITPKVIPSYVEIRIHCCVKLIRRKTRITLPVPDTRGFLKPFFIEKSPMAYTLYYIAGWLVLKVILNCCKRNGKPPIIQGKNPKETKGVIRVLECWGMFNSISKLEAQNQGLPTHKSDNHGFKHSNTSNEAKYASKEFFDVVCYMERAAVTVVSVCSMFGICIYNYECLSVFLLCFSWLCCS